jgi:DNA-directed RNA polymerase
MQTFNGIEYVKINIANCYGHDKMVWKDRIDWVDNHTIENLKSMAEDADSPMLYLKGLCALEDALEGIPSGMIMGLDATASGLQIMAALTGCEETASHVNLIDTGKRECIYQNIADHMGVERSLVKKPVMTTFYGSEKQPEVIFGENTPELKKYYDALEERLPGAMYCMETIQSCWDSTAYSYTWTLPDNHTVVMKVMDTVDKKIEVDELDHCTFTYRTSINKPQKKGLSLAANVIHSIDGYICRQMYKRAKQQGFDILTIHDSFWCHPNHVNELRRNYNQILSDIAQTKLLKYILIQITGNPYIKVDKPLTALPSHILKANYSLS